MEVITLLAYFNTSHVTVYLFWWIHYRVQIIFQYISCYCLSLNTSSVLIPFLISIHLMLLFILLPVCSLLCISRISIHLMLLFICKGWENARGCKIFQYISCYCLSEKVATLLLRKQCISIHLMLLFIMLLFAYRCASGQNFNTSHVTVYRNQPLFSVTVYPCSAKTSLPDLYHFNTSHVTVYLLHPPNNPYPLSISIHLMLLFISSTNITVGKLIIFQYISCYCLSPVF